MNSINIIKELNRGIVNTKWNVERVDINQMVFRKNKIAVVNMALFFLLLFLNKFFWAPVTKIFKKDTRNSRKTCIKSQKPQKVKSDPNCPKF